MVLVAIHHNVPTRVTGSIYGSYTDLRDVTAPNSPFHGGMWIPPSFSLHDDSARGTTTPDTTERDMDPPSSSSQDSTDSEQYDSQRARK